MPPLPLKAVYRETGVATKSSLPRYWHCHRLLRYWRCHVYRSLMRSERVNEDIRALIRHVSSSSSFRIEYIFVANITTCCLIHLFSKYLLCCMILIIFILLVYIVRYLVFKIRFSYFCLPLVMCCIGVVCLLWCVVYELYAVC